MKKVLRLGRVYKFTASNPMYGNINLYHTYVVRNGILRTLNRVGYKPTGQTLASGETFVVIDVTAQGDFLVVTSKKNAGLICSVHPNLPFTMWTEVPVKDEEETNKQ